MARLTSQQREEMWRLFARYYEGMSRDDFEGDLVGKHHVILLHDRARTLQGFSTLHRAARAIAGRRFVAVFSGDTIVAEAYWGDRSLQHAFGSYMTQTKLRHPLTPVYWFLVSKGYKTYLLLTRNFVEHWPRRDRSTPPFERAILDTLASERFGWAWDPDAGIVRAGSTSGRLRDDIAPLDASLLLLPDVRFFLEKNPGHAQGDELGCLGRVDVALWLRYALKRGRRWWNGS